jgi:hypothetical protein
MVEVIPFASLIQSYSGRDFIVVCPGKNIVEYLSRIKELINKQNLLVIGMNKIGELIRPDFHLFTNNEKFKNYGNLVSEHSRLMLGSHINPDHISYHGIKKYIAVKYTDRDPEERIRFDVGTIYGYFRTSGNLSIMLAHLMGAKNIYVAGMSGFTYNFDGNVHYYNPEINRDKKTRKEWFKKYDVPTIRCLAELKGLKIPFKIITPTLYEDHFLSIDSCGQ